jgi:hypothetical protein
MHRFIIDGGGTIIFLVFVMGGFSFLFLPDYRRRRKREGEQKILDQLTVKVRNTFDVELSTIGEEATQDRVVTVVNMLAVAAATTCMWQNRHNRGEDVGTPRSVFGERHPDVSWDEAARRAKMGWQEARKLASHIAPKLFDQMPHFSYCEPLKSYLLTTDKPGHPVRLKALQRD